MELFWKILPWVLLVLLLGHVIILRVIKIPHLENKCHNLRSQRNYLAINLLKKAIPAEKIIEQTPSETVSVSGCEFGQSVWKAMDLTPNEMEVVQIARYYIRDDIEIEQSRIVGTFPNMEFRHLVKISLPATLMSTNA